MAVFQIRQQGRHRRLERRQILPGEIPDQVKSHIVILMNQGIAETGEVAPADRRYRASTGQRRARSARGAYVDIGIVTHNSVVAAYGILS